MRTFLFLLMILVSSWSNAAEKGVTPNQIIDDRVLSHCKVVASSSSSDEENFNRISPMSLIYWSYINDGKLLDESIKDQLRALAVIKLMSGPEHGSLIPVEGHKNNYYYHANKGYAGMDKIIFEVKLDENIYKGIYSVYITSGSPYNYDGCNEKGGYDELEGPFRLYDNGNYERVDMNGSWSESSKKEVLKWMDEHRE